MAMLLSGCPATFHGNLKNESKRGVVVMAPLITENKWLIEAGDIRKVNWYQECITIKDGDIIKHYAGWPIPKNVVSNHTFSSSLNAVYKNNELYFQSTNGELVKIEEIENCDKL